MKVKTSFYTIPYFIGPIPEEKLQTLYAMSEKQRGAFFVKLEEPKNSAVPMGTYPYFTRSTGWVKIWFTEDAKLSYEFMYSLSKSLTVDVESIKKNGMWDTSMGSGYRRREDTELSTYWSGTGTEDVYVPIYRDLFYLLGRYQYRGHLCPLSSRPTTS